MPIFDKIIVMIKAISWKKYYIVGAIIGVFCFMVNTESGIGFLVGTIVCFINLFLSSKKFPSLETKSDAIVKALGLMLLEGILTIIMAIFTYKFGGLFCFIASFVGMIIPNIYFFIVGSIKK